MDERLRQLLRDRNTTAEQCYRWLARSGADTFEIQNQLLQHEKIADQIGVFQDLQVNLGVISGSQARQEVANIVFDHYDFPHPVVGTDGWVYTTGDPWIRRIVYLQPAYDEDGNELPPDLPSWRYQFSVHFRFNSAMLHLTPVLIRLL